MEEAVRLIATGGTIDCDTYDATGKSVFSETHIPQMLKQARLGANVILDFLMMKDSVDITDTDRQLILDHCISSPERKIIITHGTETMAATAQFLGPKIKDKTVVLVGSMIPYAHDNTDALFNLGFALCAAQQLPARVYVAMNGRVFDWDNVRKNKEKLLFENLQK